MSVPTDPEQPRVQSATQLRPGRRTKLVHLVVGLGGAALALLAWTGPWIEVGIIGGPSVSVVGSDASAALAALALAALVLVAALSIAGVFFRVILALLEVALGALIVVTSAQVIADPLRAAATTVTDRTGVAGDESIRAIVSSIELTAWPGVALAAGLVIGSVGLGVLVTARRWPVSSRKYRALRMEEVAASERTTVSDWDALSEGRDPT